MADYDLDERLRKVFDFLSSINQTAYKNMYLLSNEVLSKNPFSNNFLRKFLKRERPELPNIFTVLSKLLMYYLKSFVDFGIYLSFFAAFYISRLRYAVNPLFSELILIDTFFLIDRIERSGNYEDTYFVGLREILGKLDKHYAYLPVFYTTKNPVRLFKIFRLLRKNKIPVLTEYQLLSGSDLAKLFYFILTYPIRVLILAGDIKEDCYETKLLKSELIDNLRFTALSQFSRFLQGKKISALAYEKIKLISWFENQAIDKNLYKGIREGNKKIRIYGAQPFIGAKIILNLLVDENESKFGILPDKIIVNGPYFIPENTFLEFGVGPSFRYEKIFKFAFNKKNRDSLLVLLSYFEEDTKNILNLLSNVSLSTYTVTIKTHPSAPLGKFKRLLPVNAIIALEDIYELFKTAKVVVGAASGSLVEAASLGIPVISVKNIQRFDYNSLPLYGKGIIWDETTNSEEIERLLTKFENALKDKNESDRINEIASEYKKMFFCPPTDSNIIETYELDH